MCYKKILSSYNQSEFIINTIAFLKDELTSEDDEERDVKENMFADLSPEPRQSTSSMMGN